MRSGKIPHKLKTAGRTIKDNRCGSRKASEIALNSGWPMMSGTGHSAPQRTGDILADGQIINRLKRVGWRVKTMRTYENSSKRHNDTRQRVKGLNRVR